MSNLHRIRFAGNEKPWMQGEPLIERIRRWDGRKALRLTEPPLPIPHDKQGEPGNQDAAYDQARLVTQFIELLRLLMLKGNEQSRGGVYSFCVVNPITSLKDVLLSELKRQSFWQPEQMRPHARWLIEQSRHREPMHLGITLLGLGGKQADLPLLKDAARHEEFTIAAINAISAIADNPVDEWWQMARQVTGWGKIHLVKRLSTKSANRPDVKDWLLRQGWRDCISPEYVAYSCASAGSLDQALAKADVDEELVEAAGVLIGALLQAGPAEHLEDYEGGVAAISRWLPNLNNRQIHNKTTETLSRLLNFVTLENQPDVWERRAEQLGWTESARQDIANECRKILESRR